MRLRHWLWGCAVVLATNAELRAANTGNIQGSVVKLYYDFRSGPKSTTNPKDPGFVVSRIDRVGTSLSRVFDVNTDLWKVEIWDSTNGAQAATVRPTDANTSWSNLTVTKLSTRRVQAAWTGITYAPLPALTFSVTVDARTPASDDLAELNIAVSVSPSTPNYTIYAVTFPYFLFGRGPGNPSEVLTYPESGGRLVYNPRNSYLDAQNVGYVYSGNRTCPGLLGMQWLCHYVENDPNHNLLFMCTRDLNYYRKEFVVGSDGGPPSYQYALVSGLRYVPQDNLVAQSYDSTTTFPYAIGVLQGDWWDAAKYYRNWVVSQHAGWIAPGPMRTSTSLSQFIRDAVGFGIADPSDCSNGSGVPDQTCFYDSSLVPSSPNYWRQSVEDELSFFDLVGTPLPIHTIYWDSNSCLDGYNGEWLDSNFGAGPLTIPSDFQLAVNDLAASSMASSIGVAPYYSNGTYNDATYNWPQNYLTGYPSAGRLVTDDALRDEHNAVKSRLPRTAPVDRRYGCAGGTIIPNSEVYVDDASQFAVDYAEFIGRTVADAGARGLYIDVLSHDNTPLSWSTSSGSPKGGGNWYVNGTRNLVRNLRNGIRSPTPGHTTVPDFFVASEANNEAYVDLLDYSYAGNGDSTAEGLGPDNVAGTSDDTRVAPAPLFDAVYHEYHRAAYYFDFVWIDDPSILGDPLLERVGRLWETYTQYLGRAPWIGAALDHGNLMSVLYAKYPEYAKVVDTVKHGLGLQKNSIGRQYVVFGERMRDPTTNSPTTTVAGSPVPSMISATRPYPTVFASAWYRVDLAPTRPTGILLENWTHSSDLTLPGVLVGGPMTINVTFDWQAYGLVPGNYDVMKIDSSGLSSVFSTLTISAPGNVVLQNVPVPQCDGVFLYLKKL